MYELRFNIFKKIVIRNSEIVNLLRFFLKINLIVIHRLIIVKAFFDQFFIAVNVDMKVFIEFQDAFVYPALFFNSGV